jgi:hypothetical protein
VELFIASENVADTVVLSPTPLSAFPGAVPDTVGGVVSETDGKAEAAGAATTVVSVPPAPQPDRLILATTIGMQDKPAKIRAAILLAGDMG